MSTLPSLDDLVAATVPTNHCSANNGTERNGATFGRMTFTGRMTDETEMRHGNTAPLTDIE
jgi:ribulose 1,5-bisphosphate synthetase/thiazole synthase